MMMKISRSDLDEHGFDEIEIIHFLAGHGISIGDLLEMPETLMNKSFPEWKRVMSLLPELTSNEAAAAFAGVDLVAPGYMSDDDGAELSRWESVIRRAILANPSELLAEAIDFDRDYDARPKEWSITPVNLAAWCAKKGIPYPLPSSVSMPSTDAGLRDALASCERERAQWKTKVEALEAAGDQRETLQAEVDRLRGQLRTKEDEIVAMTVERDALKADTLEGKGKTTALKIIGGLVAANYKTDIHSDRLEGIGGIIVDLETVGAGVTEKTLRTLIYDSAKVIDQQKNPNKS